MSSDNALRFETVHSHGFCPFLTCGGYGVTIAFHGLTPVVAATWAPHARTMEGHETPYCTARQWVVVGKVSAQKVMEENRERQEMLCT
jgi:hypothetical protein